MLIENAICLASLWFENHSMRPTMLLAWLKTIISKKQKESTFPILLIPHLNTLKHNWSDFKTIILVYYPCITAFQNWLWLMWMQHDTITAPFLNYLFKWESQDTLTCLLSSRRGSLTTAAPQSSTIHSISSKINTHRKVGCKCFLGNMSDKVSSVTPNVILSTFTPLTPGGYWADSFRAQTPFDRRDGKQVNT